MNYLSLGWIIHRFHIKSENDFSSCNPHLNKKNSLSMALNVSKLSLQRESIAWLQGMNIRWKVNLGFEILSVYNYLIYYKELSCFFHSRMQALGIYFFVSPCFVPNTIIYAVHISLNDSLPGKCLGVQGTCQFFRVACGEIPRGGIYRMWVSWWSAFDFQEQDDAWWWVIAKPSFLRDRDSLSQWRLFPKKQMLALSLAKLPKANIMWMTPNIIKLNML